MGRESKAVLGDAAEVGTGPLFAPKKITDGATVVVVADAAFEA